jgi:hypothetical protein
MLCDLPPDTIHRALSTGEISPAVAQTEGDMQNAQRTNLVACAPRPSLS